MTLAGTFARSIVRPWPDRLVIGPLLFAVDTLAGLLLAADLTVVCISVLYRYGLNAPIEWSDDVARGLMVALSYFGAAGALARGDNVGIAFFADKLPNVVRRVVDAVGSLLVVITAGSVATDALQLGVMTTGQTTGSGRRNELVTRHGDIERHWLAQGRAQL